MPRVNSFVNSRQSMSSANPRQQTPSNSKEAKRRVSRRGPVALGLMLLPGILFPLGLFLLRNQPRFSWACHITQYPWEFWAIMLFGLIATAGGVGDWLYHRSGETAVGAKEHYAHLLALGAGGAPLFILMAAASLISRPLQLLIPVLVLVILTVILICYDEFMFHRRCGLLEHTLHRMLTLGNGIAFCAWAYWCFVRGGLNA